MSEKQWVNLTNLAVIAETLESEIRQATEAEQQYARLAAHYRDDARLVFNHPAYRASCAVHADVAERKRQAAQFARETFTAALEQHRAEWLGGDMASA